MAQNFFDTNMLALARTNNSVAAQITDSRGPGETYEFILSRSGKTVPCLDIGGKKALHSRMDPEKEASRFTSIYKTSGFLIFLGLGGGYQIRPFLEKNEFSAILIIDNNLSRVRSVLQNIDLRDILLNKAVHLLIDPDMEEISEFLLENYIPAVSGDLTTIPLRQLVGHEEDFYTRAVDTIKATLERISDDFTVQTNFGKKWFANTLANLKKAAETSVTLKPIKNAIITAAGPSLDCYIEEIREKRKEASLIATDTSLPVLIAHDIVPDMVISIDCQHISYYHFLKGYPGEVPLILDLSSPKQLTELTDKLFFFTSGHPFSLYTNKYFRSFPILNSSGGSVTHAAVSLADSLGAEKTWLYGADFSYPDGKSYARGTYIYDYFDVRSSRLHSQENSFFSFIMHNRDIIKEKTGNTFRYITKPMIGYKQNLEREISTLRCEVIPVKGKGCIIENNREKEKKQSNIRTFFSAGSPRVDLNEFLMKYKKILKELPELTFPVEKYLKTLTTEQRMTWITIIPVLANLRKDSELKPELIEQAVQWTCEIINRHITKKE